MSRARNDLRAIRNDYIRRGFRDEADKDYVAARQTYRLGLVDQFLWLGLQAVEKHLKGILLFHDLDTRDLGHDLLAALARVEQIPGVSWDFSEIVREFLGYLTRMGDNRYFERPRYTYGPELFKLDRSIWEVRRYCQDLDRYRRMGIGSKRRNVYATYVASLAVTKWRGRWSKFSIGGGYLEQVLEGRHGDEQRASLVWQNAFFGRRQKKRIRRPAVRMGMSNPTSILNPELLPWIEGRVHMTKAFKEMLRRA